MQNIQQEKNIIDLQNEDLKIEQTLSKRKDIHDNLFKTFTVDQGLLDMALKENENLKDSLLNLQLEMDLKQKSLEKKEEELQKLRDKKKFIENRVAYSYSFIFLI